MAKKEKKEKKNTLKAIFKGFRDMKYLLSFYWRYAKGLFIGGLIFSSIIQPVRVAIWTLWTKIIFDGYEKGIPFVTIALTLIGVLGVLLLLSAIQQIYYYYYQEKKLTELTAKLNYEIYAKAIKTDYKYFDNPEFYDDYTWAVSHFAGKCTAAETLVVRLSGSFMSIITLITIMTSMEPILIVFSVLPMLATTYLEIKLNKLQQEKKEQNVPFDRRTNYIHRIFYLKEWAAGVKATRIGKFFLGDYDKCVDEYKGIMDKYKKRLSIIGSGSSIMSYAYEILLYVFLTWRVFSGTLAIGNLIPLANASSNLSWRVEDFFEVFKNAQEYSLYVTRIRKFMDTESTIEVQDTATLLPMPRKPYTVEFDNVCFSYDNSDFGLKNLSFTIKEGQKIAIVGENGAGKTTMTKLLLRLYDPTSGTIKINGEPMQSYPVGELRRSIGIAFQDSPIYAMSLADNMQIYGDAGEERIDEVAKLFGIDKILAKTGATMDTQVTREFQADGLELSGGEKQRLAISRLFVADFGLIVLDEPSASLDPLAEYELNKVMFTAASKTTTLMISHRLSTVVDADCIYLVDNGEIVERGTHTELMKMGGKYAEMFTKQAENYVKSMSEVLGE